MNDSDKKIIELFKYDYNKNVNVGLYSKNRKVCFIPIHKNASNIIRSILKNVGFKDASLVSEEDIKYSVIIREPIKSWIKGFSTRLMICIQNNEITIEQILNILKKDSCVDMIFNIMEFDVHTRPQSEILNLINQKIDTFPLEYMNKLTQWFNMYGINVEIPKPNFVDCNSEEKVHFKIYSEVVNIINKNEKYFDMIEDYYKEDFNIYNKAMEKIK